MPSFSFPRYPARVKRSASSSSAMGESCAFPKTGTFTYFCTVHPFMHGTVEVVEKE